MFQVKWAQPLLIAVMVISTNFGKASADVQVEAVPGEFVVTLNQDMSEFSSQSLAGIFGVTEVRRISKASNSVLVKRPLFETQGFSVATLSEHRMVKRVEPNYIYRVSRVPNDPYFNRLWGMKNDGARGGVSGVDIGAAKAWDIHTGSKKIIVAVIDTGVDYTIKGLQPNMWTNQAEVNGQPGVDDDGNGYVDDIYGWDFAHNDADPKDDHGHGSHCSGTIGAKGDDGDGVVGVNWNVQIMALKFIKAQGGGTLEGAIGAIDYAVANGANVLSNSWGGGGRSETLRDAIVRAEQQGVLFVAAAGNNGSNNDKNPVYPANYQVSNMVTVAAINSRGKLAGFSCYGAKTVHVAAPGVGIISTTPRGLASMDGTSMAAPHVSGVAALLWSYQPNLSMAEVKQRMLATARPIAALKGKVLTGGMIDAFHALTNTLPPKDPNDPSEWNKVPKSISTEHDYKPNTKQEWTLTVPGAKTVAVHFSRFETEKGYDIATIKDSSGKVVAKLSGEQGDLYSPPVGGDTVVIEFTSDKSQEKYGFDVSELAYQ